jgi:hypothetical protein
MKRRIKKNKTKKLGRMGRTGMCINFDPKWIKKAWPPLKTPQNDGNVYIINVHVCNSTTS